VKKKIILLVDDNPDDILLTRRALKKNNVDSDIVIAEDGLDALDYLFGTGRYTGRDVTSMPALTLMDLKMPRVDGLEVLKRLRSDPRTCLLPVVILTASRESADIERSYSLGANAYVRKPVDFVQFTEAVKQLAAFWLSLNETPDQKKEIDA
jgi:CheY-like chemotaxis protein